MNHRTRLSGSAIRRGQQSFGVRPSRVGARRAITFADVLVCVGAVAVLVVLAVASQRSASERRDRIRCLSNLKQLGTAFRVYETTNLGQYPRAIYARSKPDSKDYAGVTWGTPADAKASETADTFGRNRTGDTPGANAPADNDVTASLYLVIRTMDLPTELFVCPTTKLKGWDLGGGRNRVEFFTNWPGKETLAKHLSYSVQNMYPSAEAIGAGFAWNSARLTSEHAIMSDMNPGGDAVLTVRRNSPRDELAKANSLNHRGEGQNVLYGDGHADWTITPFTGVNFDNVFTARKTFTSKPDTSGKDEVAIVASPASSEDSILLPTAADLGYEGPPAPQPEAPPATPAELQKRLVGEYWIALAEDPAGRMPRTATLKFDERGALVVKMGPVTIDLRYEVKGQGEEGETILSLTGEDIAPLRAMAMHANDGQTLGLFVPELGMGMQGEWQRGVPPATQPTTRAAPRAAPRASSQPSGPATQRSPAAR